MIRYLTIDEVMRLHHRILEQSGGSADVHDLGVFESALAQPAMTFGGEELYPRLVDKAAALGFSLVMNHPFVDGNKRAGHAAMEVFLIMNGLEIDATVNEQEEVILALATGALNREDFAKWLESKVRRNV